MTLILHEHPFAAYCWKALVALFERDVPFERHSAEWRRLSGAPHFAFTFMVL
jgi:hypothetical protein